ncbi:hypothetical protein D8B20_20860 (plasmid) [Candidatus Pantoea soli]|uniref:Uncharacterized protein n=1 Tax=Candidatus Pantoea soli TaxID=3098669 RepID=A0A518XJL0_9GAMM|nr:hypothetical protein D8B20_20860 [Pantoea soli]
MIQPPKQVLLRFCLRQLTCSPLINIPIAVKKRDSKLRSMNALARIDRTINAEIDILQFWM